MQLEGQIIREERLIKKLAYAAVLIQAYLFTMFGVLLYHLLPNAGSLSSFSKQLDSGLGMLPAIAVLITGLSFLWFTVLIVANLSFIRNFQQRDHLIKKRTIRFLIGFTLIPWIFFTPELVELSILVF